MPPYSQFFFYQTVEQHSTPAEKVGAGFPPLSGWKGSCFGFACVQAYYFNSGKKIVFEKIMWDVMHLSSLSPERQKTAIQNALGLIFKMEKIQQAQCSSRIPGLFKELFGENSSFSIFPQAAFVGRVERLKDILMTFFRDNNTLLLACHEHAVAVIQVSAKKGREKFILMGPNNCLTAGESRATYHVPIGIDNLCFALRYRNFAHAIKSKRWDLSLNAFQASKAPTLPEKFKKFYLPPPKFSQKHRTLSLNKASEVGLADFVKFFIDVQGENFNQKDAYGNKALYIAALKGHMAVVQLLLDKGAKINDPNRLGFSLLFLASQEGHWKIVQELLDRGAKHTSRKNGSTPLYMASQNGHPEVAQILLDHGAKQRPDKNGITPIFIASEKGHVAVVEVLLKNRAQQTANPKGVTPLYMASQNGHVEVVRILLAHGAQQTASQEEVTPLYIACQKGHVEVVRILLKHGATDKRANNGFSPLMIAQQHGHSEIIQLLQEHQAKFLATLHSKAWTPAANAYQRGDRDIPEFFMDYEQSFPSLKSP